MNIKRNIINPLVLLFSLAILMLFSNACTNQKVVNEDDDQNSIRIYMYEKDRYIQDIINIYKSEYPGTVVQEVKFNDYNEYKNKLVSSVMSGEGPDVIFFDDYLIESITKTIKSGAFYDLQEFIAEDVGFNLSDYNSNVLESGMFNEQRLFIPVNYSIPVIYTTKGILENNKIDNIEDFSNVDFLQLLNSYISQKDKNTVKYVFSHYMDISEFILNSGVDFYSYNDKRINLNNSDITNVIENYIKLHECMVEGKVREGYSNQEYGMLKNRELLFINSKNLLDIEQLTIINSYINNLLSEDIELFLFPQYKKDDGAIAVAQKCLAINSNSNKKEYAYNFIKIALSERGQSSRYLNCLPTNNKVMLEKIDRTSSLNGEEIIYNGINVVVMPLPEEIKNKYKTMVKSVKRCKLIDNNIDNLMLESISRYVQGKITLDKAINEAERKIELYMNE